MNVYYCDIRGKCIGDISDRKGFSLVELDDLEGCIRKWLSWKDCDKNEQYYRVYEYDRDSMIIRNVFTITEAKRILKLKGL